MTRAITKWAGVCSAHLAEGRLGREKEMLANAGTILFLLCFFSISNSNSISNSCLTFKFPSVQITTNVNITLTVSHIIIYYFSCYLFMGGINSFIRISFLNFYFMFLFKIGGQGIITVRADFYFIFLFFLLFFPILLPFSCQVYVFHKMYYHKIISKRPIFLYLLVGSLT